MNKKTKLRLDAALDKALEPPRRKNLSGLDTLLSQYENPSHPIPSEPIPSQDKPTQPTPTQPKRMVETSPVRNFTKVPNSTVKNAIPEKLFKGLSKNLYDVLYLHTRGAITPKRSIKLTKAELRKLSGLSENTVSSHIKNLRESGLIKTENQVGKHDGQMYEVFIYEELDIPTQPNAPQPIPTEAKTAQNLAPVPTQNLGGVGESQTPAVVGESETLNTLFNTNTKNDDEAFAGFIETFQNWSRANHGKDLPLREKDKWTEFAKFFTAVLDRAQTSSISSVPAFLLSDVVKNYAEAAVKVKKGTPAVKDEVGKTKKFNLAFELDVLRDLITDDDFDSVYKNIDTYDWTDEQKELVKKTLLDDKKD